MEKGVIVCGITGIFNQTSSTPICEEILRRGVATLTHRGPDADGVKVISGGVGLGHTRLAILDLCPESNQPFESDDGEYVISFNGEIFNYIELRDELTGLGHVFRTQSDTEVLLHAYMEWGEEAIPKLNGMWAFAIYIKTRDVLFCSRDRFGIKPFNYALHGGRFLFGSEVKAILAMVPELATPNYDSLARQMREAVGGELEDTLFAGVRRLKPAHNLIVSRDGVSFRRYWDYPQEPLLDITREQAAEQCRELLVDSIRLRMRSDVPIGTTLSGGIDSSTLLCLLAKFHKGRHDTFTAEFPGDAKNEAPIAKALSEQLGMTPHMIPAFETDFLPDLRKIIYHLEAPQSEPTVLPLWNIMRHARKKVTVVIEGQGADEELAGYIRACIGVHLWDLLKRGALGQMGRELKLHLQEFSWRSSLAVSARVASPSWVHGLFRRWRGVESVYAGPLRQARPRIPVRSDAPRYADSLNNLLLWQHENELVNLLQYGDAISMANSLESRLPFLDYRLVEFLFRLPGRFKVRNGHSKAVLKDGVSKYVPEHILWNRGKIGFDMPIASWFRERPEEIVYPVLHSESCRKRGIFNMKEMDKALDRHISGKADLSRNIYRWIGAELWFQEFID